MQRGGLKLKLDMLTFIRGMNFIFILFIFYLWLRRASENMSNAMVHIFKNKKNQINYWLIENNFTQTRDAKNINIDCQGCQFKRLWIMIRTQSMNDYERVLHGNRPDRSHVPFCKWGLSLFILRWKPNSRYKLIHVTVTRSMAWK